MHLLSICLAGLELGVNKAFINKIKALSKCSDNSKYKEQFLRRRISYLCLNRGAIARENALLSLIPLNEDED